MNIRHDLNPKTVLQQIQSSISKINLQRKRSVSDCIENHKLYEEAKALNKHHNWAGDFSDVDKAVQGLHTMYDNWIKQQQNLYSTVRVIELESRLVHRFLLVYGDKADSDFRVHEGTGPFSSVERAISWFTAGGR